MGRSRARSSRRSGRAGPARKPAPSRRPDDSRHRRPAARPDGSAAHRPAGADPGRGDSAHDSAHDTPYAPHAHVAQSGGRCCDARRDGSGRTCRRSRHIGPGAWPHRGQPNRAAARRSCNTGREDEHHRRDARGARRAGAEARAQVRPGGGARWRTPNADPQSSLPPLRRSTQLRGRTAKPRLQRRATTRRLQRRRVGRGRCAARLVDDTATRPNSTTKFDDDHRRHQRKTPVPGGSPPTRSARRRPSRRPARRPTRPGAAGRAPATRRATTRATTSAREPVATRSRRMTCASFADGAALAPAARSRAGSAWRWLVAGGSVLRRRPLDVRDPVSVLLDRRRRAPPRAAAEQPRRDRGTTGAATGADRRSRRRGRCSRCSCASGTVRQSPRRRGRGC